MGSFLFYVSLAGFVLGIFARSLLPLNLPQAVWLLLISFAFALLWRRGAGVHARLFLFASLSLLFFSVGVLRMEYAVLQFSQSSFVEKEGEHIEEEGVVAREPEAKKNSLYLYVETDGELLLVQAPKGAQVSYGDRIRFEGVLEKPSAFETELGRTFDYQGYLNARGVSHVVAFAQVGVLEPGQGNALIVNLFDFKQAFMDRLERVIPYPHAGLAEGLLLGVKQALGENYETAFRDTGISHIVVLSGYNIMLVSAFVLYVFSFFFPYRLRLAFGIAAIAAFALLVGLSATVVRASIMAFLLLLSQLWGRTYDVVRALLIAGTLMLFWNPHLLVFDVGFQLSFLATLGLIVLSQPIASRVKFVPAFIGLRDFLVATLAAQIFVLPILLYQIGSFSAVAVLVNVLVLPMVPVAMLLSFAAGIFGFISFPLSQLFGFAAYWSLGYILQTASFFAALPFASFIVPAFPFWWVVVSYLLLFLLLFALSKRRKTSTDPSLSSWTIIEEASLHSHEISQAKEDPVFFR